MAGLRVGTAYASREIITLMNAVKPPYNVSSIAQRAVIDATSNRTQVEAWIRQTLEQRGRLVAEMADLPFVRKIFPTDANFVLVSMEDPKAVYSYLLNSKIVVRDRSSVRLCEGCLRITVGTPEENTRLLEALAAFGKEV
jgi:histidinol-phosphate aminotransferase